MPRYIDADRARDMICAQRVVDKSLVKRILIQIPSENVVPQSVVDQIRWERDTAIAQLAEIGKGFGEQMDDVVEVVRCKDCKYREEEQPGMVYCPNTVGGWVDENWFCAGGEWEETENGT